MKILGVDPGGAGALALLSPTGLLIEDMPVFVVPRGKGTTTELDVHALVDLLRGWSADVCFFEKVGGMAGDGASQSFNFGRVAGACEALVKAEGSRFIFVTPPVWKRAMKLRGGPAGKDEARARATDLWPGHAAAFRRKCDDGRAEAALLAEYGRRTIASEFFA